MRVDRYLSKRCSWSRGSNLIGGLKLLLDRPIQQERGPLQYRAVSRFNRRRVSYVNHKRQAMTLVETLVAVLLMSLAATLLSGFLVFAMRQGVRYDSRQRILSSASRTFERVSDAVGASRFTAVRRDLSIAGWLVPVARTGAQPSMQFDPVTGHILWQAWHAFGFDAARGVVWENDVPVSSPTSDMLEVLEQVPVTHSPGARRTLAEDVKELELVIGLNQRLRLRMLFRNAQGYQLEVASSLRAQN